MYIVLESRGILTLDVFGSLAERVKTGMIRRNPSNLSEITCATTLAHYGLLGSVVEVVVCDVDLTSVPAEHLASLASTVTAKFSIKNVSGCDLATILKSVKCERVDICRQSLGHEETQALVRAMETSVNCVGLGVEVTLDMSVLVKYNGQGKCQRVECQRDTMFRYREQLRPRPETDDFLLILICILD